MDTQTTGWPVVSCPKGEEDLLDRANIKRRSYSILSRYYVRRNVHSGEPFTVALHSRLNMAGVEDSFFRTVIYLHRCLGDIEAQIGNPRNAFREAWLW